VELYKGDFLRFKHGTHIYEECIFICEENDYSKFSKDPSGIKIVAPPNSANIGTIFSDDWELQSNQEQI
jgi:hypothetical protein